MQVCGGRQAVVGNDVCWCALQAKGIDLPFDGSGGTCDETSWPHAALPTRPALCRRQRTRRWRQARPLLPSSAPPPAACCTAWPTTQTGCTATSRWGPAAGREGSQSRALKGVPPSAAQPGAAIWRSCQLRQIAAASRPSTQLGWWSPPSVRPHLSLLAPLACRTAARPWLALHGAHRRPRRRRSSTRQPRRWWRPSAGRRGTRGARGGAHPAGQSRGMGARACRLPVRARLHGAQAAQQPPRGDSQLCTAD